MKKLYALGVLALAALIGLGVSGFTYTSAQADEPAAVKREDDTREVATVDGTGDDADDADDDSNNTPNNKSAAAAGDSSDRSRGNRDSRNGGDDTRDRSAAGQQARGDDRDDDPSDDQDESRSGDDGASRSDSRGSSDSR